MDLENVVMLLAVEDSTSSSSSDDNDTSSTDSDFDLVLLSCQRKRSPRKRHRIEHYVEITVPTYTFQEFTSHFRMNRTSVQLLTELIRANDVLPRHKFGRITPETAVLLTIWYLTNQESFRQIADRFNLSLSTCHVVISKVTSFFVDRASDFIQWPNGMKQKSTAHHFESKHNIGGIIGAIDGCHIRIKRPLDDNEVYINRKGCHSILLQGVCDHTKAFIDIYCGEPGSLHDARMLRRSPLYRKAVEENFIGDMFLLGDSAYPSLNWLVPPFKDNGNLTQHQKAFNFKHSSMRMTIEHAFGILKASFRRLQKFENNNMFQIKCIKAACVLHNICIRKGDIEIEDLPTEDEIVHEQDLEGQETIGINRRERIFQNIIHLL